MSFVVRQIAKRADGGDIIRTRTLQAAEITVGRGTECDIQLADLGVMLRHARLSQLSDGTVAVEATGGIPLEISGKFLNRADLNVADNPAIDIASHRLTLSPGDTPGAIAITAERVVAAVDAADAASEAGIFSLRETMPTKRGMAWALAGFILLAFLALPVWLMGSGNADLPKDMVAAAARPDGASQVGRLVPALGGEPATKGGYTPDMAWTSGPLSTAHAGLSNNCGACHSEPFVSVTDKACVACHTADAVPDHATPVRMGKGRIAEVGFTASVHKGLNLPEGRCASCHKEHEGPRGALMVAESFCTDCHTGLSSRLTDTKIVNVPNWDEHPQFKPTIVAAPSLTNPQFERVSLASKPQERSGLVYPHDLHLSATNSVANMVRKQGLPGKDGALACNYCHTPDSDGVRFKPIEMEKNCAACHDLAFASDGGVVRTLPHGKPEQVAGIVRDFYLSQALSPRTGVQRLAFERRQPGKMAELEAADLRISSPGEARARADGAIASIFGKGGVCSDCHGVINTGAPNAAQRFTITPVSLNDHYLPKGRFPHNQHKSYDKKTGDAACITCHTGVTKSKLASEVLLPAVSQCRDCHGSTKVATNVASTCNTCHGFHYGEGGQGGDLGSSPHQRSAKPAVVAARPQPVRVSTAEPANAKLRRAGV
ncbi:MAG: cytochrome c3 family protein [Polymorphobacter sp.]